MGFRLLLTAPSSSFCDEKTLDIKAEIQPLNLVSKDYLGQFGGTEMIRVSVCSNAQSLNSSGLPMLYIRDVHEGR